MGWRKGECVLIVTDDLLYPLSYSFYRAVKTLEPRTMLIVTPPVDVSGQEPEQAAGYAMTGADIIFCMTSRSITHTAARMQAANAGARIASMPGITEDLLLQGAITADYHQVAARSSLLARLLTEAKTARLEKNGKVLYLNLAARKGIASTGLYLHPGEGGNLPSGEAYIAPQEEQSWGTMEIDGSMVGIGKLGEPLTVRVEAGKLCEISGEGAEKIRALLHTEADRTLGELGIGTNEQARLCGIVLEDEKVFGTVHIAFGTNKSFGGAINASCHLDGVILAPTLWLDEKKILEKGKFVL